MYHEILSENLLPSARALKMKRGAIYPPSGHGAIYPPSWHGAIYPPSWHGAIYPPSWHGAIHPPSWHGAIHPPSWHGAIHPPSWHGAIHPRTSASIQAKGSRKECVCVQVGTSLTTMTVWPPIHGLGPNTLKTAFFPWPLSICPEAIERVYPYRVNVRGHRLR